MKPVGRTRSVCESLCVHDGGTGYKRRAVLRVRVEILGHRGQNVGHGHVEVPERGQQPSHVVMRVREQPDLVRIA